MLRILVVVVAAAAVAHAAPLQLAAAYGSHMVLQADRPAAVWGHGTPGTNVTVTLAAGARVVASNTSTVAPNGIWQTHLPPQPASNTSHTVSARTGSASLQLDDVVYGDVLVCVGQSNMEFPVMWAANATQDIADAAHRPFIRVFRANHSASAMQLFDYGAGNTVLQPWAVASNSTVPAFSAVCYFTARALQRHHGRPMGLYQGILVVEQEDGR